MAALSNAELIVEMYKELREIYNIFIHQQKNNTDKVDSILALIEENYNEESLNKCNIMHQMNQSLSEDIELCNIMHQMNDSLSEDMELCKTVYIKLKKTVDDKLKSGDHSLSTCKEIIDEVDCVIERFKYNLLIDEFFLNLNK